MKASRQALARVVLRAQVIGFAIVVAIIWIDEVLDLPHWLLRGLATPANWQESVFETVLVGALGTVSCISLARLLHRVRLLEGIVPMCFCCHKVRVEDNRWLPLEQYISEQSAARISHGLCPECLKREYPEFAHDKEAQGESRSG